MLLQETRQRVLKAGLSLPALETMDWQDLYRAWITISAQEIGKIANFRFAEAFNGLDYIAAGDISKIMNTET